MQVRQPMESASVTPVADTLKSRFGPEVVHGLAADLAGVAPTFDVDGFTRISKGFITKDEISDKLSMKTSYFNKFIKNFSKYRIYSLICLIILILTISLLFL